MENSKLKKVASHTVAVVVGLMLATCSRNPKTQVVTREVVKEIKVEVPIQVIKEVVVTQVIREPYEVIVDEPCREVEVIHRTVAAKNRLMGMVGRGPDDLNASYNGSYHFSVGYGIIAGMGYSRLIDESMSLGVIGLSNGTFLGTMGVDF